MNYLLDTTVCSALMRGSPRVEGRIAALATDDALTISAITRGEILYGLGRLPDGRRRRDLTEAAIAAVLAPPRVSVDPPAADHYAALKLQAERAGNPLDENDLWIAATALATGAAIVTADSDFGRLAGVVIEDWTR